MEFFAGFLDDYYAECEEHITAVRRALLQLETSIGQTQLDRSLLDELFRHFHSLKGISAMVGVSNAEQLAHQMESYLRVLRQQHTQLSNAGLDALINGTKMLEQVVAAKRNNSAAPRITKVLGQLTALASEPAIPPAASEPPVTNETSQHLPTTSTKDSNDDIQTRLNDALMAGRHIWVFSFMPTPELTEQGINVSQVRSRLQDVGELIKAMPEIMPSGGVLFKFIVVSDADEAVFQEWRTQGIDYQPYQSSLANPNQTTEITPVTATNLSQLSTEAQHNGNNFTPSLVSANLVRVDLSRLDELMRIVGELVISRGRLHNHLTRLETMMPNVDWENLQETNQAMERQLRELRAGVMNVRMVPIGEIFERMQFVVHDLARESGKRIHLEIGGQTTEIDKLLVERMMDPLLHLVRNAISHGLETIAERQSAGKTVEGTIWLNASATAETVIIEIEDDGRGVDPARITQRARHLGLISEEVALTDHQLLDLICAPGFSTREQIDRVSGRGIGMAVVKKTIEELGGSLSLETKVGIGSCFTIRLPLTLSIADALLIGVGGHTFAVPQALISEVIEIDPTRITTLENNELISYRQQALPLTRLANLFGLDQRYQRACYGLVTGQGLGALGIVVDQVIGQREIVVRPITDPCVQVPGIGGATDLGDGRVVLILDIATIAGAIRQPVRAELIKGEQSPAHFQRMQLVSGNYARNELMDRRSSLVDMRSELKKQQVEAQRTVSEETFILFELAGTTYALRSTVVQQMEMIEEITPVPNAPSFVDGVVFSRGQVIPALNLRMRFGFERVPYDIRTRLIVVHTGERTVGFIVDTAREFVTIATDAIQPLNESIAGLSGEYLQGVVRLDDRLIMILNLGGMTDISGAMLAEMSR